MDERSDHSYRDSPERTDREARERRESRERREDREGRQRSPRPKPRRQSPLLGYLILLFAVAFLLLLLAYFQQQRLNSQATTDALKQSASAVQSIQQLMEDNRELREENEALRAQAEEQEKTAQQVKDLEEQVEGLKVTLQNREAVLEHTAAALDWFWQLDEAYVKGRYTLCRELIRAMEDDSGGSPLKSFLPKESVTANGRFSPADRYQEIVNALK